MRIEDLDFKLPEALIAQHPAARREDARLLVIERETGALHDARFTGIDAWLRRGDALAVNETRVRPARLILRRPTGGRIELLFVRAVAGGDWLVLAKPAKHLRQGTAFETEDGALRLEVTGAGEAGERQVRVLAGDLGATLDREGRVPLPPYIGREPTVEDRERYQTVYARTDGAVAAPTAGLHFSEALLGGLAQQGIERVPLLLHVGPGTFRPITATDPAAHRMDAEWFEVGPEAAARLNRSRAAGGRIVAVGTTSVRTLESACDANGGTLGAAAGWTRKFILPPYSFQAVDALLTNFHLPRTTLLLLVGAFTGEELLRRAYAHAIRERYRFYSYGDAMLVV
jgi:S-adenosylmethionine:tRNA ribosyltransferase-isomerase